MTLMQGFPPAPEGQVTLANWRTAPFNRWAFHHVRELLPTADIPNDPAKVRALGARPADLGVDAFLDETDTDGFIVVHRGEVLVERYGNGMTADTPHILMSVSKSMLGLVFGILASEKALDPERLLTDVLPEMRDTAYRGATLRNLLDMRVGVHFPEDYQASQGLIIAYRRAMGWNPLPPGEAPGDLRSFFKSLGESEGRHGGAFHYVSPSTDILGWAIERATGRRYADLVSELLWKPVGAERSAYITLDRLGAPRCAGGMCVTLRDLARVGQAILDGGVVPEAWIEDIETAGDPAAWDQGTFVPYFPGLPMHYRAKWYAHRPQEPGDGPVIFGFGIHGQNLWVDRRRRLVVAKLSSHAAPLDAEKIPRAAREVLRIRRLVS